MRYIQMHNVECEKIENGKNIIKSLVYTMLLLAIMLLLFEQTEKSDDYDMCMFLYGGVSGIYDSHMLYTSVILGRILVFLLKLAPHIPWYAVYMNTMLFFSFWILTYLYLNKRKQINMTDIFAVGISFAIAYEFWVRITFTKVSGILAVVGMLLLISYVYEERNIWRLLISIFCLFNGTIIRESVLLMTIFVFFAAYMIHTLLFIEKREIKEAFAKTITFGAILGVALIGYFALAHYNEKAYKSSDEWEDYFENNYHRFMVMDYGIPSYEKNKEEYKKLDISENDFQMWFQKFNYCDTNVLNNELLDDIRSIEPVQSSELVPTLLTGIKNLLPYLSQKLFSFALLLALVEFLIETKRKYLWECIPILGMGLAAYLVLWYRGRIQHHVDVIIILSLICQLVYFMPLKNAEHTRNKNSINLLIFVALFVFPMMQFGDSIRNSNYYQDSNSRIVSYKEKVKENNDKLQLLSDNKECLYLLGALETSELYPAFTVTSQVIEPGFFQNIILMNWSAFPTYQNMQNERFGEGEKLFEHIVNNDNVIYCVSKASLDDSGLFAKYLSEHYKENTEAQLVKYIEGMSFYRFISNKRMEFGDCQLGEDIIADWDVIAEDKENVKIKGYAYRENEDSFAQNIYIQVIENDEENVYYTLQTENTELKGAGKENGEYSAFELEIPRTVWDNSEEINLILETEDEKSKLIMRQKDVLFEKALIEYQ